MDRNWRHTRAGRLDKVNSLVILISSVGRRFFAWGSRVDFMEMDERGRFWWHQRWNNRRLYLHGPGTVLRRGFTHGGALRELVLGLKRYAVTGQQIWSGAFGPWESFPVSDGGLWGYGEDMQIVRDTARALGILAESESHEKYRMALAVAEAEIARLNQDDSEPALECLCHYDPDECPIHEG